eukprot:5884025-Pleurochrysis_carterae.AAC.1
MRACESARMPECVRACRACVRALAVLGSIGRTGRGGKTGIAHTFFTNFDKAHAGALQVVIHAPLPSCGWG